MKTFSIPILLLLASVAYGQSNFPACQGSDVSSWSNCTGETTKSAQYLYKGDFLNGKRHGFGVMNVLHPDFKGDKYVGEFIDDKVHGQGIYTHSNGGKYVGEYKAGKRNGQGTFTYANGNKYVGEWRDGNRNGQGTFTYAHGDKYVGEHRDSKYFGQGTFFHSDGRIDIGQWIENQPDGPFIKYRADGTIDSSGFFSDGKLVTSRDINPKTFNRIAINNTPPAVTGKQLEDVDKSKAQQEQDRKSNGNAFEKIILKTNPNKLPLCLEQVGTEQLPVKCWGVELRRRWSYVGEMNNYGNSNGQPDGLGTWTDAGRSYFGEFKAGKYHGQGILIFPNGDRQEGIWNDDQLVRKSEVNLPILNTKTANNTERNEIDRERQLLAEERRRLELEKQKREQQQKSIRIAITASATQPDSGGVVTINIQTNTDTSSLKINGEELGGNADGSYSVKRVARVGQETKFTIAGVDVNGNTDSKTITVVRQAVDSKAVFGQLNAANVKPQPAKDAVAIIIGIEKYKRVAKADFANADAQDFYDYAVRALGIKPENIKLLVDEGADDVEIYKAFQNWLPVKVKKGKTDVYVFYSGHGYPSQDGNSLYILPYGADKDLISKTAISQQEIVSAIQNAQPKLVTMFLDSCYSGQTRSGDVLIAGARPISPKILSNSYPTNFTVISASSNDQISSASPDLKHGIFSYFLMKGMEGDADLSKDGKITAAEMQEYLTDMVGRQAMGMNRKQQPQLYGDPNKVLVIK